MTWVKQMPTNIHKCQPPTTGGQWPIRQPIGPKGNLWRCDECEELWRIGDACDVCDRGIDHGRIGGQCVVGTAWRPATLWQRVRNRKRQR